MKRVCGRFWFRYCGTTALFAGLSFWVVGDLWQCRYLQSEGKA